MPKSRRSNRRSGPAHAVPLDYRSPDLLADPVPPASPARQFATAGLLAAGALLWLPPHPLADFFDTFYVLVRPKYASLYFPGAALTYVPTVWLHLPAWVMPVLVAGAIVGLTYRVVTELADGVAGALAAGALASL